MKKLFFWTLTLLVFFQYACKKEDLQATKTISNQVISYGASALQVGNIAFDLSDPMLIALCNQNQIPVDKITAFKIRLTQLNIENKASKDTLTFDDLENIKFTVKTSATAGDPIRFGDVKLGVVGRKSTAENTSVALEISPKSAGDPIRIGDVKLGLQFSLKRNFSENVNFNATVAYDFTWTK